MLVMHGLLSEGMRSKGARLRGELCEWRCVGNGVEPAATHGCNGSRAPPPAAHGLQWQAFPGVDRKDRRPKYSGSNRALESARFGL